MTGVTKALVAAAVLALLPGAALSAAAAQPGAEPSATGAGSGADAGAARDAAPGYAAPGFAPPAGGAGKGSWIAAGGRFAQVTDGVVPAAPTYDPAAVPDGAGVTVAQRRVGDRMSIALWVDGVQAGRAFGAHVHTAPCGARPEAAGPHYQDRLDPVQPSVDPEFANARNEVWLDFETDAAGEGHAESTVAWTFRAGEARSVVIHEHSTHTGEGHAGQAGARLACLTVPFGPAADDPVTQLPPRTDQGAASDDGRLRGEDETADHTVTPHRPGGA